MKRFILSAIVLSFLALGSASPDLAQAKHPKKKHHTVAHKVIYRPAPASNIRSSNDADGMMSMNPVAVHPMGVVVHPGDCDIDCMQDPTALLTPSNAYLCPSLDPSQCSVSVAPATNDMHFTTISDTTANVYYYTYVPPKVVTVGGFDVPVTGNTSYYSIFKHRQGEPMPIHNRKGMDLTRGFGVSPRPDDPPTSFGPGKYSATAIPEQ